MLFAMHALPQVPQMPKIYTLFSPPPTTHLNDEAEKVQVRRCLFLFLGHFTKIFRLTVAYFHFLAKFIIFHVT